MGAQVTRKRPTRADAQENRERIVAAAQTVFAEAGLDATTREVVRRAGVGAATLYRHFPSRRELVAAAFEAEVVACAAVADAAGSDPDPGKGLRAALEGIVVRGSANRGFVDTFLAENEVSADLSAHRDRMRSALADLLRRAVEQRTVRSDLRVDDLILLVLAGRGLHGVPTDRRSAATRRFTDLVLAGLPPAI